MGGPWERPDDGCGWMCAVEGPEELTFQKDCIHKSMIEISFAILTNVKKKS